MDGANFDLMLMSEGEKLIKLNVRPFKGKEVATFGLFRLIVLLVLFFRFLFGRVG